MPQTRSLLRLMWLAALGLIGACSDASRTQEFAAVASPHGDYTLVAAVIEPWFPQGPYLVSLALKVTASGQVQPLIKTDLAYDGVPFTTKNIAVRWTGAREALACLRASDRPDKAVQVTVAPDGQAQVIMRPGC